MSSEIRKRKRKKVDFFKQNLEQNKYDEKYLDCKQEVEDVMILLIKVLR